MSDWDMKEKKMRQVQVCKSLNEPYSHLLVVGRTSLSAALAVDVDVVTDVIGALGDVAKTQIKKPYC